MNLQYHPFIWIALGIASLAAGLGLYASKHHEVPGTPIFMVSMGITVVWALAYLMQIVSTDAAQAYLWLSVHMIGPIVLPGVWLVLTCYYTGYARLLGFPHLTALTIIPAVSLVLLNLVPVPNLMVRSVTMERVSEVLVLRVIPGPWYWVHSAFSYVQVVAIVALLLMQVIRFSRDTRRTALLALAWFSAMVAFHVWTQAKLTQLSPNPATLISSLAFLALAWGIYRFRLLDLMPVARAQVMEAMADGVIVLDHHDRIIDMNRAAGDLLDLDSRKALGSEAQKVFAPWRGLAILDGSPQDMIITKEGTDRHYRVIPLGLLNAQGRAVGQILTVRDVSSTVALRIQQEQLIRELRETVAALRTADGMLPVCAWCGKVRDGDDDWVDLNSWLERHRILELTHGVCPDCEERILENL